MNKQVKRITEDFCSYEVAKLLKEKGYKGSFDGYYNDAGCVVDKPNFFLKAPEYQYYERVSLYMAMKWLREVHNLAIELTWEYTWFASITKMTSMPESFVYEDGSKSYEEACETAIKYCLKNLI